jgi:hypothetical protein
VTWPGWLGLAQSMWAELGPAQKIIKKTKKKKQKSKKIEKIKNVYA